MTLGSLLDQLVTPYPEMGWDHRDRGREVMPPETHPTSAALT